LKPQVFFLSRLTLLFLFPSTLYPPSFLLVAKSRGTQLRVHYKNAVEVVNAIRHMPLTRAKKYLENVLQHKEIIPFLRFKGARSRHAQAKNLKVPGSLGGWPKNAVTAVLSLIKNAEANASTKELDANDLVVSHSQCNMGVKGRRRTYRAHGRINPYMRVPAHIELILSAKPGDVEKAPASFPKQHKAKLARRLATGKAKVAVGGDAQ
jgi:large subunit ribosomal protein L17e